MCVLRFDEQGKLVTHHDEDAGTEMASGEAAWGKAMGNRDGQEEGMYALEEVLEEDTADIWKSSLMNTSMHMVSRKETYS